MSKHDDLLDGLNDSLKDLLDAAEIAKAKLLHYLKTTSDKEFEMQVSKMNEDDIKGLTQWALQAEEYEVCERLKNHTENKS